MSSSLFIGTTSETVDVSSADVIAEGQPWRSFIPDQSGQLFLWLSGDTAPLSLTVSSGAQYFMSVARFDTGGAVTTLAAIK